MHRAKGSGKLNALNNCNGQIRQMTKSFPSNVWLFGSFLFQVLVSHITMLLPYVHHIQFQRRVVYITSKWKSYRKVVMVTWESVWPHRISNQIDCLAGTNNHMAIMVMMATHSHRLAMEKVTDQLLPLTISSVVAWI